MHRIYYAHAHFSDLDLDARWQWVVKGKTFLTTKQATSIKFATTVDHFFVCELDFENGYMAWSTCFFWFSGGDSVQHMSRVDSCHVVHGNHGGEWGDCHHWVWAVCGLQGLCCLAAVCWPILRQSRGRQTKRWENNINEWTGLEFANSHRVVWEQEKMERAGCKVFSGAPTILKGYGKVKWRRRRVTDDVERFPSKRNYYCLSRRATINRKPLTVKNCTEHYVHLFLRLKESDIDFSRDTYDQW